MSDEKIWAGKFPNTAFNKIGLRHKFAGYPWQESYVNHVIPREAEDVRQLRQRYTRGEPLSPVEFPEASAIYDHKCFARQKAFSRAGFGYIVDARVADILSAFDLGPIGLFEYTIYEADEQTRIPDQWWMLGLGVQKKTFVPSESKNVKLIFDGKGETNSAYKTTYPPGDDALTFTADAFEGPDLWVEAELMSHFGFSSRLAHALFDAGLASWFDLQSVRVLA